MAFIFYAQSLKQLLQEFLYQATGTTYFLLIVGLCQPRNAVSLEVNERLSARLFLGPTAELHLSRYLSLHVYYSTYGIVTHITFDVVEYVRFSSSIYSKCRYSFVNIEGMSEFVRTWLQPLSQIYLLSMESFRKVFSTCS